MDTRFSRVRSQETVAGNLLADLYRVYYNSDVAICNGGSIRANEKFEKGQHKARVGSKLLPLNGGLCQVLVSGKILLELAENGVSLWPKCAGKWSTWSGLKFKFDPCKPVGKKILLDTFKNDKGEPIKMDKTYKMSVVQFLLKGQDGFSAITDKSVKDISPPELPGDRDVFIQCYQNFALTNE